MGKYAPSATYSEVAEAINQLGVLKKDPNTGQWSDPQIQGLVSGGGIAGQAYILKSFTGRSQLTGGTANVKTALMEVPIPDGWLSRLDTRMDIELTINYTNNADNKEWGVAGSRGFRAADQADRPHRPQCVQQPRREQRLRQARQLLLRRLVVWRAHRASDAQ